MRGKLWPWLLLAPMVAWAGSGEHASLSTTFVGLALFLALAGIGGDLAERLGQPSVLGELLAGVALGNLDLIGLPFADPLAHDPTHAEIGVVLLLFEVGWGCTSRARSRGTTAGR